MAEKPATQTLQIHYLKSSFFRVIHVDGAIGGLTPSRDIFVSLFNQRGPMPDMTEQEVLPNGELGEEVRREVSSEGLVRELEVGMVLSPAVAEELATFLLQKARAITESIQSAELKK